MTKLAEPKKYNLYMSTKGQEISENKIREILTRYFQMDIMSTDMHVNMINTGGNIIVGTFPSDITKSKCSVINKYCIEKSICIYCWGSCVG